MTELTEAQAAAIVAMKHAPKVTKELINGRITDEHYVFHGTLTVCIVTVANGFKVVGTSAAAAPENFDEAVGRTYARLDCVRQLFALEGYLLREQLFREAQLDEGVPL